MNFKILKDDTQKIVYRSNVRPDDGTLTRNLRVDPDTTPAIIKSRRETFADRATVSTDASTIPDDGSC